MQKAVVWSFGSAFHLISTIVLTVWGEVAAALEAMRNWKVP